MAEPGPFFGAAAEAMRRILIEKARRRQAAKRGGGWERLDLDHVEIATPWASIPSKSLQTADAWPRAATPKRQ
jgi:hypothetical protein